MHVCDKVIVSSDTEKAVTLDDYAVDQDKVSVIAPGVDLQQFQPVDQTAARAKFGLPPEGKILLSLGRMVKNKGYHLSIQALAELKKKYTEPVFLAIFGGSAASTSAEEQKYRQELEMLIQTLGLQDSVFLHEAVEHDHIQDVFAAADVFLMSSEHEPFGLVTIEAMAMGLPIVAANAGGSLSILTPNRTGVLTDFHQPERVASYLRSLLLDEEMATTLGQAAQRQARREYDWRQKSEQFAQAYRQISRQEPTEAFRGIVQKNHFLQKHFSLAG